MAGPSSRWRNSTFIRGNVVEEVRALKAQPGKNILIDGSSVLVHTLARHDLIDEYRLIVYPVVLGAAFLALARAASGSDRGCSSMAKPVYRRPTRSLPNSSPAEYEQRSGEELLSHRLPSHGRTH